MFLACDDRVRKDLLLQQCGELIEKLPQQDRLSKCFIGTVFLARQARCPILHLASASSFSVFAQGRFVISASRPARFSRVRFAIIWINLWKSIHSKKDRFKTISNVSMNSQYRTSVQNVHFCRHVLQVVAIYSFVPILSSFFRESSRIVCYSALFRRTFNSARAPKRSGEKLCSS